MNRWRLLRLGRTEISLHPVMLLYALYATASGHGLFMAVSTGSILLHEGAHAAAAALLGQPPRKIELTPLGAVMRLEDENRLSPLRRSVMLLAGPAATFLLCRVAVMMTQQGMIGETMGHMLFLCNLSILLVNLLPAMPLDGGRLVSLLLGIFMPIHTVHHIIQMMGSVLGLGFIALNIYTSWKIGGWNLSLALAGCCMLYAARMSTTTEKLAELQKFLDRRIALERKGSRRTVWITAIHTQPLSSLVRLLPSQAMAIFLCVEAGSMKPLGWITESELIQWYLQRPEQRIGELCKSNRYASVLQNL